MRLPGGRGGDGACLRGLMLSELMTVPAPMAAIVLGILLTSISDSTVEYVSEKFVGNITGELSLTSPIA